MPVYDAATGTWSFSGGLLDAAGLQPVVDAITGNLGVLLPVGISIIGIMIGVALIPRIIYKFF